MAMESPIGYLVLGVEEAVGKTQTEAMTWDTTTQPGVPFEAFVKVELRGGARNIKAQTKKMPLVEEATVRWQEELHLDVLNGSNELRLMLCREKYNNGKKGTAVIAACGIFVSDILDAVPIDKYFELFKPNAGGEGGYIRISMNYVKDLKELQALPRGGAAADASGMAHATSTTTGAGNGAPERKKGSALRKVITTIATLGLLAAAGFGGFTAYKKLKEQADSKPAAKPAGIPLLTKKK